VAAVAADPDFAVLRQVRGGKYVRRVGRPEE
jgi:hypothetical protein